MEGSISHEELGKLYDEAMDSGNQLVAKLVREIWLLHDMNIDTKNMYHRTQSLLREERAKRKDTNPAEGIAIAQKRFLEAVEGISEEELVVIDWPAICEAMIEARRKHTQEQGKS